MIFEWDENKAKINLQRHDISFEEAEIAFDDANAVDALDESHSEDEIRFNLIGLTEKVYYLSFIPSAKAILFASFQRGKRQNLRKKFMSKNKEIVVEVSREQYEKQIAEGLSEDEVLKAGKHRFKRGGFRERHPNFSVKNSKTRINICIDSDILQHFRQRAESPHTAPYQTQINNELRAVMERDLANEKAEIDATAKKLLEDDDFLKALSEKLKEKELLTA